MAIPPTMAHGNANFRQFFMCSPIPEIETDEAAGDFTSRSPAAEIFPKGTGPILLNPGKRNPIPAETKGNPRLPTVQAFEKRPSKAKDATPHGVPLGSG